MIELEQQAENLKEKVRLRNQARPSTNQSSKSTPKRPQPSVIRPTENPTQVEMVSIKHAPSEEPKGSHPSRSSTNMHNMVNTKYVIDDSGFDKGTV